MKGHIKLDNPVRFKTYLGSMEGKAIELVLRERQIDRDSNPRGYYFGVLIPELTEANIGYESREWHEILKEQFKFKTTKGMPTRDFWSKINEIRRWAAEFHGVKISDPDYVDY